MINIQIFHETDTSGRRIVRVPLHSSVIPLQQSGRYATLYEQDYNDLIDLGLGSVWKLGSDGLVQISVPGRTNLPLARLITNAFRERVVYLNGDKTCLLRDNLVLDGSGKGHTKLRARDLVVRKPKLNNKIGIEHVYRHGLSAVAVGVLN